ncbi:pseudaminic acid synthase [Agaribacter marinus]|uniref:Pseudaminic acid synthase n=1 Tax=Agaribacter marinus TaxID=1431249 RepID=A0AA37WK88_9ALTE|nr:pseudaminic acid synthase [Agaribacter marinus]GLR70775.1 pseudaminic acid synthase [Agaribacter marinus]
MSKTLTPMIKPTRPAKPISIGHKLIGDGQAPFIIAELSGNHNQSLETALALVDEAAKAGADAIKLQTYTADTMTLNTKAKGFVIEDKNSLWCGENLYALYEKASTPYDWHTVIFERAKALGMLAFSSPFDASAVDFLERLNVPCYKVASFELTDVPLVRKVASTGKPMIMSTGMASLSEIELAVNTARSAGCEDIILLKCTSTYPAEATDTNLLTIPAIEATFGCAVGLSDHTKGIGVSVASVALGACVIEKHFVLDRSAGGVDADFSLEPQEFSLLSEECKRAFDALGQVHFGGTDNEQKSKQFRRSLYVSESITAGEMLTPNNVKVIRPGYGLAPKHYDSVMGKTAKSALSVGTPISWELID